MADREASIAEQVEHLYREESGKILAGLIRRSGSFDLAEEALQDAFAAALMAWRGELPDNPAAWLTSAAQRKVIDYIRRDQTRSSKEEQLLYETPVSTTQIAPEEEEWSWVEDDRLRLIFTCCHPALNREAQVALTLKTLGGLTTAEIARAFLLPEATLAQRIVRAKRKIEIAKIPYEVPSKKALPDRVASVQAVLYLIFNEGYSAASGDALVRRELCAEAIRLARLLHQLMPNDAESMGLLALMLLQDCRSEARSNSEGELLTLEEQDRKLWKHDQISEGVALVTQALGRRNLGAYQLQAAIAAVHSEAASAADTDWKQITALYGLLAEMQPTSVVLLNYAVAVAMSEGFEVGLRAIEHIGGDGALDGYHLFHAARADLLQRLGWAEEARSAYQRAMELATNEAERKFLAKKVDTLDLRG